MESDKPLSIRLPKFRGAAESWFRWRDAMEAIFGAYKLMSAIDTPRPFFSLYTPRPETPPSAPVVNQAGATVGGGGADGDGGTGEGGGGGNAGGGVAVTGGGQQPGLPGTTPS